MKCCYWKRQRIICLIDFPMDKIKILFSLVAIVLSVKSYSYNVKIIVKTPFSTPEHDPIFLTNSSECQWRVKCIQLKKKGSHLYETNLQVEEKEIPKVDFKITRGSWSTEVADAKGKPWENIRIEAGETEVVLNLDNWKDFGALGEKSDRIIKLKNFFFPRLGYTKNIYIYLPPNYLKESKPHYPVIYAHDGNNLFFPEDSTFGKVWSLGEVLDRSIEKGEIPPTIVVGISSDNTLRYDEYNFERTGVSYAEDVVKTLIPYIDDRYRTFNKNLRKNYLMGSSMGAMISFKMLMTYPHIFSRAAGLSLPAFIHDRAIFNFINSYFPPFSKKVSFYFDHGDYGIDQKYDKSAQEFHDLLLRRGYLKRGQLKYLTFPYADHTEVDWARRVHIPLKFLLH